MDLKETRVQLVKIANHQETRIQFWPQRRLTGNINSIISPIRFHLSQVVATTKSSSDTHFEI
jgi:hypothetical protein